MDITYYMTEDEVKARVEDLDRLKENLQHWIRISQMCGTDLIVELEKRRDSIRRLYTTINIDENATIKLAEIQSREREVTMFIDMIKNTSHFKKTVDEEAEKLLNSIQKKQKTRRATDNSFVSQAALDKKGKSE